MTCKNNGNESQRKLKMLRVGMTYPRDIAPGIGQHAHYYSMYSDYDELILTRKRPGIMPENREGVRVVEIETGETKLSRDGSGIFRRLLSLAKKLKDQYVFCRKAKKYIKEFNPDVVHVFSPIPIMCGIYARKKCKSKIVMSLHGSDALRIGKQPSYAKLLKIPDAVLIVGENMVDMLPPNLKLKRPIKCIGNGVDLETFTNRNMQREKQFVHVANLRWQKGQEYLISGFAKFHKENPDYSLVIIGDGEEKEALTKLCAELEIKNAVDFRGTQGREYIAAELNKSRAFVLTSVSEGFPKVIIEAMATGTPVISSDVGNVKNVVGNSGIIFPMKDADAVYNAMKEIAFDSKWEEKSSLAEKMGSEYGWNKVVKILDEVYTELLSE